MTSSKANYLAEAPPPKAITLGVMASTYGFGGRHRLSVHSKSFVWSFVLTVPSAWRPPPQISFG